MQDVIKFSTDNFEKYDYSFSKSSWEQFFMNDIADNYLEIVKQRLWQPENFGKEETLKAQQALYHVLLNSLKGLAPITPFITEEIYQNLYKKFEKIESIHLTSWPEFDKKLSSRVMVELGNKFVQVVTEVRKFKSENQLSMKEELSKLEISCDEDLKVFIQDSIADLKAVTSVKEVMFDPTNNHK